jgi:hypothetical protein
MIVINIKNPFHFFQAEIEVFQIENGETSW